MDLGKLFRVPSLSEIVEEYLVQWTDRRGRQFHDDWLQNTVNHWLEGDSEADDFDPDDIPRWGTCHDLSTNDVRRIVQRCMDFQKAHGSVREFHDLQPDHRSKESHSYSLGLLRQWLYDERFKI